MWHTGKDYDLTWLREVIAINSVTLTINCFNQGITDAALNGMAMRCIASFIQPYKNVIIFPS